MEKHPFRLVLDVEATSSPHLVERLGRVDPFEGAVLCGKTATLTTFGRSIVAYDAEVCRSCMDEAHRRWRTRSG